MTEYFKTLSNQEFEKLKDAISLITVLIGGADGEVNEDEIAWAEKVTKIRSYKMSDDLIGFYQEVGVDFADKLDNLIKEMPKDVESRTKLIAERLELLNPVIKKLDPVVAHHLYSSYISFSHHVAKASGGFLGFFSVGPKEKALQDLPMLEAVAAPSEEEE